MIDLAKRGEWPPLGPDIVPEWYFWHLTLRGKPMVEESVRDYLSTKNIPLPPISLTRLIRDAFSYHADRAVHQAAMAKLGV